MGYQRKTGRNVFIELTDEAAYWLGFLMADGCVVQGHSTRYVRLELAALDKEHIHKFKSFLRTTNKIYERTKPNGLVSYSVMVGNNELVDTLISYGIDFRKSLTATASDKLTNNSHFWRGLLDGDGSLYIGKNYAKSRSSNIYPHLIINGSMNLMNQFLTFAKTHSDFNGNVFWSGSIWRVNLKGQNAYKILSLLYQNASTYLDRKYEKAQQILILNKDKYDSQYI